jgi:PAT family beta-lactamase induction signal transducer AmpG
VQAFSAVVYWGTAVTLQDPNAAFGGKSLIVGAAYFESFAAGLGTSAYLAFLMSVCEKRYAATQFAVLSALLALTRWIAGDFSGNVAEHVGYAHYFLITFLLGLPAFALIPRLRKTSRELSEA